MVNNVLRTFMNTVFFRTILKYASLHLTYHHWPVSPGWTLAFFRTSYHLSLFLALSAPVSFPYSFAVLIQTLQPPHLWSSNPSPAFWSCYKYSFWNSFIVHPCHMPCTRQSTNSNVFYIFLIIQFIYFTIICFPPFTILLFCSSHAPKNSLKPTKNSFISLCYHQSFQGICNHQPY